MNNTEYKYRFINLLMGRDIFTKPVNGIEYVTRCPYCGDSENENHGHFYIRVDPTDNMPIIYHCFKCEEKGVMRPETLSLLELTDIELKSGLYTLNKTCDKLDKKNLITETKILYFDYEIPDISIGNKTDYICQRLGRNLRLEDFNNMRVITSLSDFLNINKISSRPFSNPILRLLENNYVGFLSNGNSHILFRDITGKEKKYAWVKYPITEESGKNRVFYSLKSDIDIYSYEPITINLAEGVMDILSAKYNLGYHMNNCLNIAVLGKYYERILLYLIDLGLVGNNITVNIFADNDYKFNNKGVKIVKSTSVEHYKKLLKNYSFIFKDINLYYNMVSKDIGVPKDNIQLQKYKIQ